MKKKLLAMLLSAAMVLSLAACGGGDDKGSSNSDTNAPASSGNEGGDTNAPANNDDQGSAPADIDYGSGVITVWVAEAAVEVTQKLADEFFAANPDMAGYTVDIQPTGEGDAAGNMILDVEGGADIYGFAQDQLGRLVMAGALTPITGNYASAVESDNAAGAVAGAKMGDQIYAFPMTADNGYFLYYDKSVVTDPTSLDKILEDCAAAGKSFYFEVNSGWYQTAFFFGAGCELTYESDDSGALISSNITYATANGVKALKGMIALAGHSAFVNGSSLSTATNPGAIVDGTWDSGAAKELFGENYACAKLPSYTVDGENIQLGGFCGFKLLGVKPQTEQGKMLVCLALAQYLTNTDAQVARFTELGWGPCNIAAQNNEAVQADEALSALGAQFAYMIPQGQYPDAYWQDATGLGDDVIAGTYNGMSDDELMTVLQNFQDLEKSYAAQ